MHFNIYNHRNADIILKSKYTQIYEELINVLKKITVEQLHSELLITTNGKSISNALNVLIRTKLERLGWHSETYIFPETSSTVISEQGKVETAWRLDFSSCGISVEIAYNHGEAIAWNLIKPVLASELNHVEKQVQTEIGILITANRNLKTNGNFDGAVGTFEKFKRYIKPMQNQLTVPILLVGLDSFPSCPSGTDQLKLHTVPVTKDGKTSYEIDVLQGISGVTSDWKVKISDQIIHENHHAIEHIKHYSSTLLASEQLTTTNIEDNFRKYEGISKSIVALNRELILLEANDRKLERHQDIPKKTALPQTVLTYKDHEYLNNALSIHPKIAKQFSNIINKINDFKPTPPRNSYALNKNGKNCNKSAEKILYSLEEEILNIKHFIKNSYRTMIKFQREVQIEKLYKAFIQQHSLLATEIEKFLDNDSATLSNERKTWSYIKKNDQVIRQERLLNLNIIIDSVKVLFYADLTSQPGIDDFNSAARDLNEQILKFRDLFPDASDNLPNILEKTIAI